MGSRLHAMPVLDWAMLQETPQTYTQTYTGDLHLHSRYAYATSKQLSLENLAIWAKLKGIDLLSSADFTHPLWMEELRAGLAEDGKGLFQFDGVKFILGTEVSCVYRQGGRHRRVHLLVFAPGPGHGGVAEPEIGPPRKPGIRWPAGSGTAGS